MALHMQVPTTTMAKSPPSSLALSSKVGLRPPSNPFALKSWFFSGSLNLLHHPALHHLTSAPPRISMRVASKQAYICRDCGFPFIFSLLFICSLYIYMNWINGVDVYMLLILMQIYLQ